MPSLPGAEQEVRFVADFFEKYETFYREQATESAIGDKAPRMNVLHFACHGVFDMNNPKNSALMLTPEPGKNDGRLQLDDILNLKLENNFLVVLSACETGLSQVTQGDELIGLNRAFIYAGAPTIISSLWSVSDESTSFLMKYFYTSLDLEDKAGSFRRAQLKIKNDSRFSHPFYWSGFYVTGDWR
jgi:CHAT domain-containing protein